MNADRYDVVVIGGGHAGAEAAHAAARRGAKTALLTMSRETIAQMSCNPAIGGLAKGQIVREVDALGGLMGLAIDETGIQFRMLNRRKGPAVWGPRAQADKGKYQSKIREYLLACPNLDIQEEVVSDLVIQEGSVCGVRCESGRTILARSVVITTGTFLRGLMHLGPEQWAGGRYGEPAANTLSASLERAGLTVGRLKTGTPPRLDARTIDYSVLERQDGDPVPAPFSFMNDRIECDQVPCWIAYTHEATHTIIRQNLDRAPLYTGQIQSTGPRYCPSIETKIIRFADKSRHQLFLEPETRDTCWVYCNGLSTSLPQDAQEAMIHSIPGLERTEVLRYGYAIEYDYVPPLQIRATLETKTVKGLFLAGQINGTSGYEEAAGQGLLAGVNAARSAEKLDPVTLRRDQAYIGVMIDDLVTKGVDEPYRMFTSRAEHRLLLRTDNADERLTELGRQWGLVPDDRWRRFQSKRSQMEALKLYCESTRIDGKPLSLLLRQQDRDEQWLLQADPKIRQMGCSSAALQQAVNEMRYAGYVEKQKKMIDRFQRSEYMKLPHPFDYQRIPHLRFEAREKLNQVQPLTLGQARRISGINPADLAVLMIYLDPPAERDSKE